ncbi:MAG: YbaN family protein [Planctomyces sp.]
MSEQNPSAPLAATAFAIPSDGSGEAGKVSSPELLTGLTRWMAIIGAGLCLALAMLGLLLPGLPTTPFLLLASYLLVRSSPRLHRRLTGSRVFGPLIRNWETRRAISLRTKMWALTVVICSLIYTLIAVPLPSPVKIVIGILGSIGITVICRLRVLSDSDRASADG